MKKIIKSRIFLVIITMIICISGTLYAASTYKASDVVYNASDGTSTNVESALNDLYNKTKEYSNNFFPFNVNYVYNNYIGSTNKITFTTTIETGNIDITKYKIVGGTTRVEPWLNTQGKYIDTTSSIISCKEGITTIEITVTIDAASSLAGPVNYSGAIYRIE